MSDVTLEEPTTADADAIRNLIGTYSQAGDDGQAEAFASLFTRDGEYQTLGITVSGREQLARLVAGISYVPGKHMHSNIVLKLHGATATASSDLLALAMFGDTWQIVGCGRYEDELVKDTGRWYIRRRVCNWHPATPSAGLDMMRQIMSAATSTDA